MNKVIMKIERIEAYKTSNGEIYESLEEAQEKERENIMTKELWALVNNPRILYDNNEKVAIVEFCKDYKGQIEEIYKKV
jgi:hypothetical protein